VRLEAAKSALWYAACVADEVHAELAEAAAVAKACCCDAFYRVQRMQSTSRGDGSSRGSTTRTLYCQACARRFVTALAAPPGSASSSQG